MTVFLVVLAVCIIIASIIAFFVSLVRKGEESFEKRIRTIYLYIIELAMIVMIIGGAIGTIVNAVNIAFPNESSYWINSGEEYRDAMLENSRVQAIQETISSAGVIIVALPVFIYHSKKIISLRKQEAR